MIHRRRYQVTALLAAFVGMLVVVPVSRGETAPPEPASGPSGEVTPRWAEGDRLQEAGKYREALAAYIAAMKGAAPQEQAELLVRQAAIEESFGDVDAARKLLVRLVELAPVRGAVESARLMMEYPPHDAKPAVALLASTVEAHPADETAHVAYANALITAGELEEASRRIAKLLGEIAPSSVPARWARARLLAREGRVDESIEVLVEAHRLAPQEPRTMVKIGIAYLSSTQPRRLENARTWFEQASAAAPGDAALMQWVVLGYLLEDRAGDSGAQVAYMQEKFPGHSATHWAQGALAEVRSEIRQARDLYMQSAATDTRNLLAYYSLGQLLSGRGNREWSKAGQTVSAYSGYVDVDEAMRHLGHVLASPGEFPFAQAATATLAVLQRREKEDPWRTMAPETLKQFHEYGKALERHY